MEKKNKYFLIAAGSVLVSLLVLDFVIGLAGDYAMKRIPDYSDQLAKDNFRLNRVTTDVIIVGSSRGAHHYVTTELQDSINNYTRGHYSLYNGAIDGKFINSNSCAAESIMDRYTPSLLIFEVSEEELAGRKAVRDMEFAAVNKKNNQFVKRYINDLVLKEQLKTSSNMYRYNQQLLRIASSFLVHGDSTGYEPLYKKMIVNNLEEEAPNNNRVYDEYSMANFKRVLKTANEKGVHLVIVSSPMYKPVDDNMKLAQICHDYEVPYIELYNLDYFNSRPELFQDRDHLNDEGAHLYTNLFFQKLKPFLSHLDKN